jgi:hemolysin activation/secretion protein
VLTNFVGSAVTVEQVLMAQKTLNLAYRRQGYVTVSTTLPPQKITNGVVQLNVTEGRLAEITVIGNNYYSSNNVMRALPGLVTNTFLQTQWFNPELDRANLNSDRQIYPEIVPGPEPGTSAIVLKVKDRLPLHARLEVNNQSTPGTPDMRVNTSVQYNNLWQYEHSIGAQYSFSPERMKEQNRLPERFYDHPLLANYSAYYRMPLTSAKSYRSMFADDPKSFGYDEATKRFNLPPSTGVPELSFFAYRSTTDTGIKKGPVSNVSQTSFLRIDTYDSGQDLSSSDSLGARVTFPLPEIKSVKSSVSAGIDFKSYRATSYNTNNFPYTITVFDAFGVPTEKTTLISAPQPSKFHALTYLPMNLRWDGGVADKWGQNSFFAGFNANIPVLSSSDDFKGLGGGQARNDYLTTVLGISREQRLPKGYSILFRADGQWANLPLASNEQYGIAGSAGVRGYQDGEQFGDSGWKVSIEPRTPFFDLGMVDATEPMRIRGSLFMDYGMTFSNDPARGATKSLWGAGVGLQTLISTLLDARLSIGWALNESKISPAGSYRVTFAVGANF